jgi:hypothetical protein
MKQEFSRLDRVDPEGPKNNEDTDLQVVPISLVLR